MSDSSDTLRSSPASPSPTPTLTHSSSDSLTSSSSDSDSDSTLTSHYQPMVLYESNLTKTCCDHIAFLLFYFEATYRLTSDCPMHIFEFIEKMVATIDVVDDVIGAFVDDDPWIYFGSRRKLRGTKKFYGLRRLMTTVGLKWSTPLVVISRALFRLAWQVAIKKHPVEFRTSRLTVYIDKTLVHVINEITNFQKHRVGISAPKLIVLNKFLTVDLGPPPSMVYVPPEILNNTSSGFEFDIFRKMTISKYERENRGKNKSETEMLGENENKGESRLRFENKSSNIEEKEDDSRNKKRRRGHRYLKTPSHVVKGSMRKKL